MIRHSLLALLLAGAAALSDVHWTGIAFGKDGDSGGGSGDSRSDSRSESRDSDSRSDSRSESRDGDSRSETRNESRDGDSRSETRSESRDGDSRSRTRSESRGGDPGRDGGDPDRAGTRDGSGRGRGGEGERARWGTTTQEQAREAVAQGWALSLSSVLPAVSHAVPGRVLQVDLRKGPGGEWRYEFLVLTPDRRYREVVVDARRNQVLQVRRPP